MRPGRLIVVTAVALAGLGGCADRPNDLDTYYDDPRETTEAGGAPSSVRPSTSAPAVPAPPPTVLRDAVGSAVLTDADVAAEGVQPVDGVGPMSCLAELPRAAEPELRRSAHWEYPTGSVLRQQVIGYPDRPAAEVLGAFACAAGQPFPVTSPAGAEAERAWCVGTRCTVLLARGRIVSGVQVDAGSAERAREATVRLTPVAAVALRR
ncbi:hypothetical protein [Amycolatopsis cihanbeyliensis]|uniref:PknH-like protein n=1 Tax=Amycolatopsis cihanbeyliensis TaxID=1128664 RepID=A0A542DCE4_AMYCI|nr:hypothetical protein [Amycolatopsis cihanbeyliensis]TQJ00733.1 hypothetical protein FB471_0379 [Amycolatopsis cihanbeyliensis]